MGQIFFTGSRHESNVRRKVLTCEMFKGNPPTSNPIWQISTVCSETHEKKIRKEGCICPIVPRGREQWDTCGEEWDTFNFRRKIQGKCINTDRIVRKYSFYC